MKIPEPLTPQTSAPSSSGAVLAQNVGIPAVKRQNIQWYDRLNPNAFGQEGRALQQTGQMITQWGEQRKRENDNLLNLKQYSESIEEGSKEQQKIKQVISNMGEIQIDPVSNEQSFVGIQPESLIQDIDKRLENIDSSIDKTVKDPMTRERVKFQLMQQGLAIKAQAQVQASKVMKKNTMDAAVNSTREQLNTLSRMPAATNTQPERIKIESDLSTLPQSSNGLIDVEEAKEKIVELRKEFARNRISYLSRLEDGIELAQEWLDQTDLIDEEEKIKWDDHLDKLSERLIRDENRIAELDAEEEKEIEEEELWDTYTSLYKRAINKKLTYDDLETAEDDFIGHKAMYDTLMGMIGKKEDYETDPDYYAKLSSTLGDPEKQSAITREEIWSSAKLSIKDKDHFDGIIKKIKNGTLVMDTFAWKEANKLMGVSFGFPTDATLDVTAKQRRAAAWLDFYRRVNKGEAPNAVAIDLITTQSKLYDDPTSDASRLAITSLIKEIPPSLHQSIQVGKDSYPDTAGMRQRLREAVKAGKIKPEDVGVIKDALGHIDNYVKPSWIETQQQDIKKQAEIKKANEIKAARENEGMYEKLTNFIDEKINSLIGQDQPSEKEQEQAQRIIELEKQLEVISNQPVEEPVIELEEPTSVPENQVEELEPLVIEPMEKGIDTTGSLGIKDWSYLKSPEEYESLGWIKNEDGVWEPSQIDETQERVNQYKEFADSITPDFVPEEIIRNIIEDGLSDKHNQKLIEYLATAGSEELQSHNSVEVIDELAQLLKILNDGKIKIKGLDEFVGKLFDSHPQVKELSKAVRSKPKNGIDQMENLINVMEQLGITEKESKQLKFYKKVLKQQKEVMKKKKRK